MATERSPHWAEDEDTLDRFLRGEIGAQERAGLENHLLSCPECATLVRAEGRIVRGLRAVGRDELRRNLRGQILSRSRLRTGIIRWTASAAVLIVAVAIWYVPYGDAPEVRFDEVSENPKTEPDSVGPAIPHDAEGGAEDGVVSRDPAVQPGQPPPLSSETSGRDMADEFRERIHEPAGVPRDQPEVSAGEGFLLNRAAREERELPEDKSHVTDPDTAEEWLIAVEVSRLAGSGRRAAAEEDLYLMRATRPREQVQGRTGQHIVRQVVMFAQDGFRAAPPDVQSLTALTGETDSPALAVRSTMRQDTLLLTLFPKTPFPEAEVQQAMVFPQGSDSMEIRVGSQAFRFRRPLGMRSY